MKPVEFDLFEQIFAIIASETGVIVVSKNGNSGLSASKSIWAEGVLIMATNPENEKPRELEEKDLENVSGGNLTVDPTDTVEPPRKMIKVPLDASSLD